MKKKRPPSQLVKCDICGKEVFERGLKSHVRLQHHLHFRKVTQVVSKPVTQVITQVKGAEITSVKVREVRHEYFGKELKCPSCGRMVTEHDLSRSTKFQSMSIWDPRNEFCRTCGYYNDGLRMA
jgi:acetyl-CoA carboxylase beta subunit